MNKGSIIKLIKLIQYELRVGKKKMKGSSDILTFFLRFSFTFPFMILYQIAFNLSDVINQIILDAFRVENFLILKRGVLKILSGVSAQWVDVC